MNKIFQIATRTFTERLNLKTLIFCLAIMTISVVIFSMTAQASMNFLSSSDLRVWEATYSSIFLGLGILWIIGIPTLLYFSFILSGSISEEINSGLALLIFTRPVKRGEFLLGRFIGIFLFFNLINGILLFSFPLLANLLLGMDGIFLVPLLEISLAMFAYGFLLNFFLTSLGVFLSSNVRKNLVSISILFTFILIVFVASLFLGVNQSELQNYTALAKPFFSVFSMFDVNLVPEFVSIATNPIVNSYRIGGDVMIENFSPLPITLLFALIIPIILIIAAIYTLSRQDVT